MNTDPPLTNPAWSDKFTKPDESALLDVYGATDRMYFDGVRAMLAEYEWLEEELCWNGLPWQWSFAYRNEDTPPTEGPAGDAAPAWAYLVPDPNAPIFAFQLARGMVEQLPTKRVGKYARECISSGRVVGQRRWVTMPLAAKSQVAEVIDLIKRKHHFELVGEPVARVTAAQREKASPAVS
ncbi:MAG: hypothetical protein AAGD00_06660 [Planctomycetota bacterium]